MRARGDKIVGMKRNDSAQQRRSFGNTGRSALPNRRDLPLPLLLIMAAGAVAAERLGRRGLLLLIPGLLVCVALGTIAPRLAGRTNEATTTTAPADNVAFVAPSPEATLPAQVVQGALEPTAATNLPASTAEPAAEPTAAAVPTGIGGQPQGSIPTIAPVVAPTTGVTVTPPAQPRGTTVIPILMYHYVRVVTDPKDQIGINLSVKPDLFDAQMQYLADKGYTTLTMQEVYEILNGQKTLPAKPIALTFDDGYRDFYTNAWPILQKHNFKATNYVITDFIGWDAYMTWPMLQELDSTRQIELGAHTRSHADLRTLSNERRWDEIIGSKSILEQGLGHPIGAFCYPAGFYNAAVIADVKRAKFLTATTVTAGTKQNLQSAYEMPRVRVNGPDTLSVWANKFP
jgi:peptidoglycan/xylan/chitin deacetylase (PgdA/CDA1 family)